MAKPSLPKLPARGYYKKGDGYKTLENAKPEIIKTQKLLNWYAQKHIEAGKIEKIEPDGKYGDKPTKMTKYVQGLLNLEKNGCFGNSCLSKLKAVSSPAPVPKVAKKTVAVQDKNPERIDYQKRAVQAAKEIFPLAYKYKCKHGEGGYTKELIKKNKRINCSGSCSAVYREIGVLKAGRVYHKRAVGSGAVSKKNTFSKAVGGNINGLQNCKIVKIGKLWKDIPSKYKVAGASYVQGSNFFMYMGDGIFFNCNQSGRIYENAKMYTKKSGYVTNHAVLYGIIPNKA